ncbi:MAG: calcium/sodium antiporter [Myxococcales bacterium]|nr:calcium/sodium antiporter [Myxococcales bacterium]MCB9748434.1 calcium/sodium antiporter [Myxococcales bacterium]
MSATTTILFFIGLVLLVVGADLLVRGASNIANRVGISQLVVGLTVVAFGTSAPELAVSVNSALTPGDTAIQLALGNVIGSNLFNVLVILGMSAVVAPLVVERQLIRLDVPVLIFTSVLCYLLAFDGSVGRVDGLVLFAGVIAYTYVLIRLARRSESDANTSAGDDDKTPEKQPWSERLPTQIVFIAIGLGMLVIGAEWLVNGAVEFARMLGVGELIIGLTVVAAGTSLPELATSIIAVTRGQRDIAVGNAIGSSIFNVLLVLGLTAGISEHPVPVSAEALSFDIPVMIAVSVACLPSFITGQVVSRGEGLVFAAYYVAYTVYRVLAEIKHESLETFSRVMLWFAIPLTVVAGGFALIQEYRQKPKAS